MRQITKDVNKLKERDTISVLLFSLYKLSDEPEYSAISDLAYVLDKDSLYKLCSVYGGCTIKIPKLSELKTLAKVLLLVDLIHKGFSFDDAIAEADIDEYSLDDILKMYDIVSKVAENFIDEE